MAKKINNDEPDPKARLSIPLKQDGTADLDGMRPSTREKFSVLAMDYVAAQPDPENDGGTSELFGGITQENVRAALDIFSQANALIFRVVVPKMMKHPLLKTRDGKPLPLQIEQDIILRCFKLTDDQHAELDPRLLAIAKKHGQVLPEWLQKNLDVYMLVGMYLKYTAENAGNAIKTQLQRDIARVREAQAQHVTTAASRTPGDADRPVSQPSNGHDKTTPRIVESFEPGSVDPGMVNPESETEQP